MTRIATNGSPDKPTKPAAPTARNAEPVDTQEVARFRAFMDGGVRGPSQSGVFKVTFGTDQKNKDALWKLTDHQSAFFEIIVRRVTAAAPQPEA